MIGGMLTPPSVSERLGGRGGIDSFFDVLLLGCYTHRVLDEIRSVVPLSVKPGSVRILAFNNPFQQPDSNRRLHGSPIRLPSGRVEFHRPVLMGSADRANGEARPWDVSGFSASTSSGVIWTRLLLGRTKP